MFQFPGFASTGLCIQPVGYRGITLAGFPHSDISGSTPACGSPKLIAANHALHRLLAPRHPPCALSSLTIKPFADIRAYRLKARVRSRTHDEVLSRLVYWTREYCHQDASRIALATIVRSIASSFDYSVFKDRDVSRRELGFIPTASSYSHVVVSWWRKWDSNPRPSACKADALPAELFPQIFGVGLISGGPGKI